MQPIILKTLRNQNLSSEGTRIFNKAFGWMALIYLGISGASSILSFAKPVYLNSAPSPATFCAGGVCLRLL